MQYKYLNRLKMFRINIRKELIYRGQFCRSMHKPSHEHVSNDEIMSPANG